jgi:hypothetical protein
MFNMHFICFLTSFKNKYSTILIAAIIISSNLFGQASKVGFGATAGSSNSPSGYLGVAALYNLSKKFQVGAGVGLSFALQVMPQFHPFCVFLIRINSKALKIMEKASTTKENSNILHPTTLPVGPV